MVGRVSTVSPVQLQGASLDKVLCQGITSSAPLGIWCRCYSLVFNATLIVTTANAEVPLLAPVWVPRVGNLPILLPILDTPTYNLNSMSAHLASSDMVINATGVVL